MRRKGSTAEAVTEWQRLPESAASELRPLSIAAVVQGPLRCFDTGSIAAATVLGPEVAVDGAIPLLTVREFGQSAFCQAMSAAEDPWAAAPLRHLDLSSGLSAARELGIFRINMPPAMRGPRISVASTAEPLAAHAGVSILGVDAATGKSSLCRETRPLPYLVGYFRTERHCRQLGRLVGAFAKMSCTVLEPPARALAEDITSGIGTASVQASACVVGGAGAAGSTDHGSTSCAEDCVVVFMPFLTEAAFSALCNGLADVGISAVTHCTSAITPLEAATSSLYSAHLNFDCTEHVESKVVRTQSFSSLDGRSLMVHVLDMHSVKLPMQQFRRLLAGAAAAVVTGDASLNEALCCGISSSAGSTDAGLPFWYSTEPHKRDVDSALRAELKDIGSSDAQAVCALWDLLDSSNVPPLHRELLYLVEAVRRTSIDAESPDYRKSNAWDRLRFSFSRCTGDLIAKHGHLGGRVVHLINSVS